MDSFSALLVISAGNSPVTGEFPTQRPVTRSFDAFFDVRLNKRLSKQWWCWRFETPSRSLWRHCNDKSVYDILPGWNGIYIYVSILTKYGKMAHIYTMMNWFIVNYTISDPLISCQTILLIKAELPLYIYIYIYIYGSHFLIKWIIYNDYDLACFWS